MILKNEQAFTLIELIVVMLMVSILAGIALPQYRRSVERARATEAQTMLRAIHDSCERWAWEHSSETNTSSNMLISQSICFEKMGTTPRELSFAQLDLISKGTYEEDPEKGYCLNTGNFKYCFNRNGPTDDHIPFLRAWPLKEFKDEVFVSFDGGHFQCGSIGSNGPHGQEICEKIWAVDKWNE